MKYTPLRLALIVAVGLLLWLAAYPPNKHSFKANVVVQLAANSPITVQVPAENEQWVSGIYIDNDDCFIRIQSGDTVPLSNYFASDIYGFAMLRLIIDGKAYWIKLWEEEGYIERKEK